ncbi:acyl-CoA thioesterase [Malonomonas rubra DSM 5091]|uniref:Acyl-CoA thioesterase n=1 Tax=Malonomonas rubra DSM 5091 TaxID=1122189 RepID=A0A1M6JFV5_MALRU|nr:PaaI family thioesterase [Malonomonas rubra]SHJ45581.1 acyl-CoA thioesterase [Malonomonas rubra DSM 5091]
MENKLDFFRQNDQFAKHCGIELLDGRPGWAKAKMEIKPIHLNGAKTVHGGAIFTLADFTFAVASNSHGQLALAINTSMSFVKAAYDGVLFAEAKELSLNRKLGTYEVRISDEEDRLIAQFQGTAFRKEENLITTDS